PRRPAPVRCAGRGAGRRRQRGRRVRRGRAGAGMMVWQSVRIALSALRVNKLRSALTMLGIIMGVGAVIAMVAVGAGAQARVAEQIQSLGSNLIIVLSGSVTASGDRLGQIIRIRKVPFTVVGLLERKGQNSWGQDQDDIILIPLSTAKKKVLGTSQANARSVGSISVKIRSGEDMAEAENQMRALLR